MSEKKILQLGDERLYQSSAKVKLSELEFVRSVAADLRDTMRDFRQRHGWGRAIAAPQIGIFKQIIFAEMDTPLVILNPVVTEKSTDLIELWDDCMSFPELLVKVKRHQSFRISYRDESWEERTELLKNDRSELLQHEIDHLHGILATMRAVDSKSFALQNQKR